MTNTAVVQSELHELAKAHLLAESAFNRAYDRCWLGEVMPCSDEIGWKLLDAFRAEVEEYHFKLGRPEQGITQAAWEIFRLVLVGEADYDFADLVGFVKWYRALTSKIGSAIGHLYEFHGDSFGDLVDSYPLAGRELVERALATHPKSDRPRREGYVDEEEVRDAVLTQLGPEWRKLMCAGPNYVTGTLETACRKCYLHRVLTGQDIAWTSDEKRAANFARRYND